MLLAIDPIILFLMAASVLPRVPAAEGRFGMRADWTERRSVFLTLFAVHQCIVWVSVAILRPSMSWDFASLVRTVSLLLILLLLFFKTRRLEWIAALTIFVLMVLRISAQPVR